MRCPKCATENREGRKFCAECGAPLNARCASCGAENDPAEKFCGECGVALAGKAQAVSANAPATKRTTPEIQVTLGHADTSTAAEGERKTVTALFADIKGSTELMRDLDPEEARAIVDPVLRLMMAAVHRYGGYVAQSTGDGIFALFGAPVAHEDHPQRALHAALAMQEELRRYADRLRAEGKIPVEARVGVNTGEVVVRTIETGGHTEYTPVGHVTNLAARMQTAAPAGSIAASEATKRLCEGYFEFRTLGPTVVKGLDASVELFEVVRVGPLRAHFHLSARRGLTNFVGRERELAEIKRALELARSGHGQLIAVVAEAGTGKSRLFYEFKATVPDGVKVLEACSVSHGKASAWLPVLELLRGYFCIQDADEPPTRREKVRTSALDPALSDTLPYLLGLLGIQDAPDPLAQMDPQIRRRRTLEAIRRIILGESLKQPIVVIFEDLHWIDGETQALLDLLVDSVAGARILLLVNYRPEYRHEWSGKSYYTQLRLDPLGGESAGAMLTALLGDGAELGTIKQLIAERTGGNPFFMEEVVQALFDQGALMRNGAVKVVRPLSQLRLPPTVQGVLAARIDQLSAAQKGLLQTLAVIGREAPFGLIEQVVGTERATLERTLAELRAAEFIYEQPALADIEYVFKHALTQEVAYNSLLVERRRPLHERTAQAIEALYRERLEDHYTELTHHYRLSSSAGKALRYAHLAAAQAVGRGAYSEATSTLEPALKLLDELPDGAERLRAELALRRIEFTMAFVLCGTTSQEVERSIKRMCELGEKIGEADQLLLGLNALCALYFNQGESLRGLELSGRCLELAEVAQHPGLLAEARGLRGVLAYSCGKLREAVSDLEAVSNTDDMMRHQGPKRYSLTGVLQRIVSAFCRTMPLQLLGASDKAGKLSEEGLRHARETKHLFSLGFALSVGATVHQYRREPKLVRAHSEEAITLSEEYGFPNWLGWARFHHGWALAELGQLEQGVAEMEVGIATLQRQGGVVGQQYAIALLANGYARLGRAEEAISMLTGVLAHVGRTGEKVAQAEMLRLKGEVLLLMRYAGAAEEAERCFRAALEVARAQEARWWELRATTSLAGMLAKHGRRDEARTMLAEIYGWFTEGFDTADLKDAKTLLDELSA